jgi:hypothetical protein
MNVTVPAFVTYLAAWLGLIGGIWTLFERTETALNAEVKDRVGEWLQNQVKDGRKHDWTVLFREMFDSLFTKDHFSFRCFFRSCIASATAIVAMFVIVTIAQGGWDAWQGTYFFQDNKAKASLMLLGYSILSNALPDYVSLLETRLVIHWMTRANGYVRAILVLVDIVLTFVIFIFGLLLAMSLLYFMTGGKSMPLGMIWSMPQLVDLCRSVVNGSLFWADGHWYDGLWAVWLYPAYLTSFWIWLFVVGGSVIKALDAASSTLRRFMLNLDLKAKPLRSIAVVCMLIVTLPFVILPFST